MRDRPEAQDSALYRVIEWTHSKLFPYSSMVPDGCPNCGFLSVNKPEYDTCPFCDWGPDTEPEKTAKEAREEFLKETIDKHVKLR